MKCPKCGFNSFESYDSCKKCSADLTGYKLAYSITPMVLSPEAKEKLSAEFMSAESEAGHISDAAETHDDIFSFDLPESSSPSPVQRNDDPFNFDEPSLDANQPNSSKSEDDVFANLLESTSQAEESPFGEAESATPPVTAAKSAKSSSGSGEFDLESFSWDDAPTEVSAADGKEASDDFDSLFGDTKENTKK